MSAKDIKVEKLSKATGSPEKQNGTKVQQKRNLTDGNVSTLNFPVGNTRESNYSLIKEQLLTFATMNDPTVADIFKNGTLKEYNPPEPPDLLEGQEEAGRNLSKMQTYKNESVSMFKKADEQNNSKPRMFEIIWSVCSVESENILKKQSQWKEVFEEKCPLRLWKLVELTHQVALTRLPAEDRYMANIRYIMMRMRDGESLPDYRKRYQESLTQRKAAGCDNVKGEDDAFHYICSLRKPFIQARKELTNLHLLGISEFPNTAEEAHTIVSNLNYNSDRVPEETSSQESSVQAMFATYEDRKTSNLATAYTAEEKARYAEVKKELAARIRKKSQEKKEKKDKKKSAKKKEDSSTDDSSEDSTSRKKSGPAKKSGKDRKFEERCKKCNRTNHHTDDCYSNTKVDDKGAIIAMLATNNTYDSGEDVVF